MSRILAVGDSLPARGYDGAAWPDALRRRVDRPVQTAGTTGATMVDVRETVERAVDDSGDDDPTDAGADTRPDGDPSEWTVVVHAGHNDAQLSGGDPRVPVGEFRTAAARLDDYLADHARIDRHAFLGLVPLLPRDDPGSVALSDDQPGRSLDYDDALGDVVQTHLPVARPVGDWYDRTADGVHPDEAGRQYLARRVADWL